MLFCLSVPCTGACRMSICRWLTRSPPAWAIELRNRLDYLTQLTETLVSAQQRMEATLMATVGELQQAVTDLQASIAPLTNAKDGVIALLTALTAKIAELLASGGTPDEILASIKAVNDAVKADTQAIADATVANTPAQTPTP